MDINAKCLTKSDFKNFYMIIREERLLKDGGVSFVTIKDC